ncbi:glycosyltransferase family A protein [Chryseobacterium sp. MP_3.2]|uniref:glycosyltransferase family A protein n=1 Tax=Chryseobacterium sp. MP_3.2 TaxID=3071712 RepID=UPI002E122240
MTIFTPTYNRGYILEKLYRSLQRQTIFDFEWLVINDGSTDNTDDLFNQWLMEDNKFPIRYYKQTNKGLMVGFNRGVELAKGIYLSKIDSDDYVSNDCVEYLLKWLDTIKDNKVVYAVGGMRGTVGGIPLKGEGEWPLIDKKTGYLDIYDYERKQYNLDADMTEAWNVSVLRNFPFPVFEGEFFAPEAIVFNAVAVAGHKIRWFPKIICICEYQNDGLTKNDVLMQKRNPLGFSMAWKYKLKQKISFKSKMFCLAQSGALALYSGKPKYIWIDNDHKFLSTILLPVSYLIFLRRRKQFENCIYSELMNPKNTIS